MCGIFAFIFCGNPAVSEDSISKSFMSIKYRGPDRRSEIWTHQFMLGFHRLAIVDTSSAGDQPFRVGNTWTVCNGEIYNHMKLREEYKLTDVTGSDCVVIPHLYRMIGLEKMVSSLDGVFAFILIDGNDIYVVRDRIGVRPVFYGFTNNGNIVIASEIKALNLCTTINPVLPASIMKFSTESPRAVSLHQYFSFPQHPQIMSIEEEILFTIRDKLITAVKKRLMADRPIGCLLSGGLDSSLVAYILSKEIGERLTTYSIGMEGSIDLKYASQVAKYLNTNHTEVKFTPEEGLNIIPEVIRAIESHDITTVRASVGMYLLGKYISQHTNDIVIFSGEGSDEVMCGYLYFHLAPNEEELYKESHRLISELYKFDVLRADRCISAHGLELRVPFLDIDFVSYVMTLSGYVRQPIEFQGKKIEKYVLRKAFEGYLPTNVLWRRKDGFSDAISSVNKPWFKHIQEYVDNMLQSNSLNDFQISRSDMLFWEDKLGKKFHSPEAYYYWKVYAELFNDWKLNDNYWMPKWSTQSDPSGRLVEGNTVRHIYDESD